MPLPVPGDSLCGHGESVPMPFRREKGARYELREAPDALTRPIGLEPLVLRAGLRFGSGALCNQRNQRDQQNAREADRRLREAHGLTLPRQQHVEETDCR